MLAAPPTPGANYGNDRAVVFPILVAFIGVIETCVQVPRNVHETTLRSRSLPRIRVRRPSDPFIIMIIILLLDSVLLCPLPVDFLTLRGNWHAGYYWFAFGLVVERNDIEIKFPD